MQITLDVPAAAGMAANITEIMAALTPEQKVATAVAVVTQILNDTRFDAEFLQLDNSALAYARSERYHLRERSDDEVRRDSNYASFIDRNIASKGPRGQILRTMMATASNAVEDAVKKTVEESAVTKATIQVVSEHLIKSLPDLIGKALMLHVAGNLDRAVSSALAIGTMPIQDPRTGAQHNILTSLDLHQRVSALVQSMPQALGIPNVQP